MFDNIYSKNSVNIYSINIINNKNGDDNQGKKIFEES